MGRTLSAAAMLLVSGCLGDLVSIGDGPEPRGRGGTTTSGASSSGASGKANAGGEGGMSPGAGTGGAGPPNAGTSSGRGGAGGTGRRGSGGKAGGPAGAGGFVTTAGTGGKSGLGGEAGGGTSGTAGSGVLTSDPDVIARAAVAVGSCWPDDGVSRAASQMWHWREYAQYWARDRLQAECIAQAGQGCDALDTCLGWAIEEEPGCTQAARCDGSDFSICIDVQDVGPIRWRVDCATLGLPCDPNLICSEQPAAECNVLTFEGSCSNDRPLHCSGAVEPGSDQGVLSTGPECGSLGLDCATVDPYGAICIGAGEECDSSVWQAPTFEGIACAGDTLEACSNGRRHDLDCTMFGAGFTCQSFEGNAFCGLDSECLPAGLNSLDNDLPQQGIPEPACEGSTIVFCNAGRLERVDCIDLGFTGCDVEVGIGCVPSPTSEIRRQQTP